MNLPNQWLNTYIIGFILILHCLILVGFKALLISSKSFFLQRTKHKYENVVDLTKLFV